MDDSIPTSHIPEEVYERFQRAAAAGLTRRFGPSAEEVSGFPAWKRGLARALPVSHRWRFSALAPYIRWLEGKD